MTGNGAPSGPHYNLNILGKDNCPGDDLQGSNRHTIFVLLNYYDPTPNNWTSMTSLDKRNKIFLQEGEDFAVIDAECMRWERCNLPAARQPLHVHFGRPDMPGPDVPGV